MAVQYRIMSIFAAVPYNTDNIGFDLRLLSMISRSELVACVPDN